MFFSPATDSSTIVLQYYLVLCEFQARADQVPSGSFDFLDAAAALGLAAHYPTCNNDQRMKPPPTRQLHLHHQQHHGQHNYSTLSICCSALLCLDNNVMDHIVHGPSHTCFGVNRNSGVLTRHEICQIFYTSRLLTKTFLPESA